MGGRLDAEQRRIEDLLDKIEDRLREAPSGLHATGEPASAEALAASPIPKEHHALWERWNGLDLGHGETTVLPVLDGVESTSRARAEGRVAEGDVVVGEHGHDELVLAADPYAEGADVLLISEDGERLPYASTVPHLVLGALADVSILYDHEGEFQGDLFDDDGELLPAVERRMLRRRLDFDPDAPLARVELGRSLRSAGELTAARSELRRVLRIAPEFSTAHYELGLTALALADEPGAARAFAKAANAERDEALAVYFLAWVARVDAAKREALAAEVRRRQPEFVASQCVAVRDALQRDKPARARDHLELGLAIAPTDANLLVLRAQLGRAGDSR